LLQIQRCTPVDLPALLEVAKVSFREAFTANNSPEKLEEYIASAFDETQFLRELNNPGSEFYLARSGERPVGYLKVNFASAQTELQDPKSLEVQRIYVLEEFHGKGVAQVLLQQALEVAAQHQLEYLWLGVWEHNLKAVRFYRKHGFETFGSHPFLFGSEEQTDLLMKRGV
jgi:ribosomal protein S18 acetylase RimI-like enzyme